ncbi:hypothetical protein [Nocardioides speluncae]|uniref:hypothetical protein n=1 Tax=Nocardioides speluncae TaxID=2670337 RepID=UPI0012B1844C|nr:hypothetical protein [Nocardioides speluncae]
MSAAKEQVRAAKSAVVAARLTPEQADRLDEVRAEEPALPTRSAAVRRLIDRLGEADGSTGGSTGDDSGRQISPDDVAAVLAALDARTRAYNEMAKQLRAIGTQNNELVKLGHQQVRFGRLGVIPVEAVQHVERRVASGLDHLVELAEQDAHVEAVVRACRP